jgi:hypothetical protein
MRAGKSLACRPRKVSLPVYVAYVDNVMRDLCLGAWRPLLPLLRHLH